ncbi:hypothetical protein ACU8NH_09345 [Rhizobium leguminosarum]
MTSKAIEDVTAAAIERHVENTPKGYRRTEKRDGFAEDGLVPISQYGEPSVKTAVADLRKAADAYVSETGIEHSGGIIEAAFEAGAGWARFRYLPSGFSRREIEDMLSIVQDEEQTVDGGGEFGPQESTDGWYARLLRTILINAEVS